MPRRQSAAAAAARPLVAPAAPPVAPVPLPLWRSLYIAADDLRQLAPWRWMAEEQLFAVQSPRTGELCYCSLLGQLGEFCALAVYLGSDGLDAYYELASTAEQPSLSRIFGSQRALLLSFEGRGEQAKEDLAVVNALGLKYRGAQAWPLFRSSRPSYLPWLLEQDEAELLLAVLTQVLEVAARQREQPGLVPLPPGGRPRQYFTRVGQGEAWADHFLSPAPRVAETLQPEVDAQLLETAAKRKAEPRRGVWQLDYRLTDARVAEPGKRPFLGGAVVIADGQSRLVLSTAIVHPSSRPLALSTSLLEQLRSAPAWPERVEVRDAATAALLLPVVTALALPVVAEPQLTVADEVMVALNEHVAFGR